MLCFASGDSYCFADLTDRTRETLPGVYFRRQRGFRPLSGR